MGLRTYLNVRATDLRVDERGIALISALGMLAVLSGLGASLIAYSSSNYRSAEISQSGGVAAHVAEAGLNEAISVLANSPDPSKPDALPPGTATIDGENVSWSGVLDGDTWTITAVSTVRNPTGASPLPRTVTGKARVSRANGAPGFGAWNYVYADDVTTCMSPDNNIVIQAPLYVRGHVCLQNTARVAGSPVKVGGTISVVNPQASVGALAARVEVHVGGGCRLGGRGAFKSPCTDQQKVYARSPGDDARVEPLSKPPVDLPKWYADSKPGPRTNCTQGSFPGGFDTNAVMDRSLPHAVNLMPPAPYDCVVTSGPHTLGKIAWTGGSKGTLTVAGTLFFDGDIVMTNNTEGVYRGRGVIYASGRLEISNWTALCGTAGCDPTAWDPNENLLIFVAGSKTDANGLYMDNNAKFQGGVYAETDMRLNNSAILQGPAIARQLYFSNYATSVAWKPIGTFPVGIPAAASSTSVALEPQSWGG